MAKTTVSKKDKRKKRIATFFVAVTVIVIIMLIVSSVIDALNDDSGKNTLGKPISHNYTADYSYDIMSDEDYLYLDRFLTYTGKYGTTRIYTVDDAMTADEFAVFFKYWFDAQINGKSDIFDGYYTDKYIKKNGHFERFTPQQIYNMEVIYLEAEKKSDDFLNVYFKVNFSVRRNNGTLWNMIESNSSRPMLIKVVQDQKDYSVKIDSVGWYNR